MGWVGWPSGGGQVIQTALGGRVAGLGVVGHG